LSLRIGYTRLYERHDAWADAPENQFVVFVWLGSPAKNEGPKYWIASNRGGAAKARAVRRIAKLAAKIAELKKVVGTQS
jgi:hypothetical protein